MLGWSSGKSYLFNFNFVPFSYCGWHNVVSWKDTCKASFLLRVHKWDTNYLLEQPDKYAGRYTYTICDRLESHPGEGKSLVYFDYENVIICKFSLLGHHCMYVSSRSQFCVPIELYLLHFVCFCFAFVLFDQFCCFLCLANNFPLCKTIIKLFLFSISAQPRARKCVFYGSELHNI